MKILIVEDDIHIRKELSILLKDNNYEPLMIEDFDNVTENIKTMECDLILLDINLPNKSGYEICKELKKIITCPIIFVTSRNTDEDELMSIRTGGIDFITKPYNKNILIEKIKRTLEITNPKNFKKITKKEMTLDLHLSILKYQDQEVELTRNEFKILYYFFMEEDRVITKEELLDYLWNDKYYLDENILIVNINRLRKKAKEIGIKELLQTIRGEGYRL